MKKYDSIIKIVEKDTGLDYSNIGGKPFKALKVLYILAFIYTMGINLLYFAGMALVYSETELPSAAKTMLLSVAICTALLIVGFVLLCVRFKIIGCAVSIASMPYMLLCFAKSLEDSLGFWGYKASFYWRHLIPIALLFIFAVSMLILLAVRYIRFEKQYRRFTQNLYEEYRHTFAVGDEQMSVSDEKWQEFLKNYNSDSLKVKKDAEKDAEAN